MPSPSLDRRPFIKAFAGGAVALAAVGGAARVFLNPDGSPSLPGAGGLRLSAESGSDVESLYVGLGDDLLPRTGAGRWRSSQLPTSVHSMVALTWTPNETGTTPTPQIHVRSREDGDWGAWRRMSVLHDLPDVDSGEGTDVIGTDLVWIGKSDGIQVDVKGERPDDLRLLLLHPTPHREDRAVGPRTLSRARAGVVVATPTILNRTDWGANESWRGKPQFISTIEQVHVHHTVSRNDYAPEDVPALIRGMYRYHTHTLGWSDIGYNFLVDRFGRVWTGRAGGAAKAVRGAHTLGFNASSTGISVIGNYDLVAPSSETLDAVAAVAAWKLDLYARDPLGTVAVVSEGSDRFRRGVAATLPVIDGHRDTNETACPGSQLYAALPDIRARARARTDQALAASQAPVAVVVATTVTGSTLLGQALSVVPGAYSPTAAVASYTWSRDGVDVPGATGPSYLPTAADVGHLLAVRASVAAPGRSGTTETVAAGAPVTAPAVVTVVATARPRRAVVRVEVSAPDGSSVPVSGQVVIRSKKRTRTLTLVNGRARTKFKRFGPGRHVVHVEYSGGGFLTAASGRSAVTIR
jgi:hypothetical protein